MYLKAFIKLTRQKAKAQHHHSTLLEALRLEGGQTPNIKHNIPKAPTSVIIKWNQSLFRTTKELSEILSTYWSEQVIDINFEFEKLKADLESKTSITQERWDNLHEILDNISASVTLELKCKKARQKNNQQRAIKQASKFRIADQQKNIQTSEALQAVKIATPNQSTVLYTQETPKPQRERRE